MLGSENRKLSPSEDVYLHPVESFPAPQTPTKGCLKSYRPGANIYESII